MQDSGLFDEQRREQQEPAEQQNAGRYTVRWNGSDDRGVSVSSGIYFYQISAGDFSDVKKLMLLK